MLRDISDKPAYIPYGGEYMVLGRCIVSNIQYNISRDDLTRDNVVETSMKLTTCGKVEHVESLPNTKVDLSDYSVLELLEEAQNRI